MFVLATLAMSLIPPPPLTPVPESPIDHEWVMPPDHAVREGWLSAYSDGVMERVIDANDVVNFYGWMGYVDRESSGLDGYIAVAHCGRRGQMATLLIDGVAYRTLVVDCLAGRDRVHGSMFDEDRGYVGEVDFALGSRVGVGQRSVRAVVVFD